MFYELMMKKKGIPSRYQEVEYIESTGTQYIDTRLVPITTFKYKIKYSLNSIENQVLFGSRTSGAYNTSRNQIYYNVTTDNSTFLINLYGVNSLDLGIIPTINDVVETPVLQNENCVLENATRQIYLFALNNKGSAGVLSKSKMYYFQIYDNNSLLRNFIPVYDTLTQKYGMWESVQGKFYGNDGTGDFKGSIVGYTIVGSPTITDGVVSGFDVSNYLQVPTDFNNNNFEMILKLEDIGTQNLARTIMRLQNADITIGLTGSNQLSITGISDLSFSSGFNTSGILYVKFVQKGLDYSFGYSNDGITYIMLNKTLTQQISYVSPNRILQSGNWSGISVKLYVKDCRIWINNKLWFNGQQA